jgi:hypothetical protein
MNGFATIRYKAVLVGKRHVEGSFQAPEDMLGVKRESGTVRIDRAKTISTLRHYLTLQSNANDTSGLIDVSYSVLTVEGYEDKHTLKQGFMGLPPAEMVSMVAPPPKISPVQAQTTAPAPVTPSHSKPKKGKGGAWYDKHDDEDAIPDEQLTPAQRRRRKELADRAEQQAFNSYNSKRSR